MLNFDKVEALSVRCSQDLKNANGSDIKSKDSLKYLAYSFHADGHILGELKQRLAMARDDFVQMRKIWKPPRPKEQTELIQSAQHATNSRSLCR